MSLAVVAAGWLAGWWLLARLRRVGDPAGDGRGAESGGAGGWGGEPADAGGRGGEPLDGGADARVEAAQPCIRATAVIVPARNEAHNLPALLDSLTGIEPIVVDDGSTDATAAVAAAHGARVIEAPPPPSGANGKAWACRAGVAAVGATAGGATPVAATAGGATAVGVAAVGATPASRTRLVFVDADVRFEPGGLARIEADHDRLGGLLSVEPWHRCQRPVESLSALFNLVSLMASGAGRDRTGAAFGPVVVCWAADYQWAGGHEPAGVLDDVALARAFRAEGLPVTVRAGRGTAWFRMYPLGLGQLVEGWSKNMAQGARSATRPVVLVLTVLWIVAMATAAVPHGWLASGGAYAAVAAQLAVLERRVGRFSAWVWVLWPVALAFFVVVFAWSVVLTATGRPVRWRGRRVAAAP